MSWFQLDAESIAQRAQSRGAGNVPTLGRSLARGAIGFTIVSLAGFAPWGLASRWFHRTGGEAGLYGASAIVFIGLSGLLLHKLIMGAGSLARFYKLFGASFAAYAVLWTAGWMTLRGNVGGVVGLLAGTAAMGWMFTRAFDAPEKFLPVAAALFLLNGLGYFAGGWVLGWISSAHGAQMIGTQMSRPAQLTLAKFLWGACYGAGFGAGLGLAFHQCQARARALISVPPGLPAA